MVGKLAAKVFGIERLPSANGQREDLEAQRVVADPVLLLRDGHSIDPLRVSAYNCIGAPRAPGSLPACSTAPHASICLM